MTDLHIPDEARRAFSGAYECPAEDLDDLVAIRAIAAPVVAAELCRNADFLASFIEQCGDEMARRAYGHAAYALRRRARDFAPGEAP